jgi:hypothetical protein
MLAIPTHTETDDPSSTNNLRRTSSPTYLYFAERIHVVMSNFLPTASGKLLFSKILHRVIFSHGFDASYRSTKIHYKLNVDRS